PMRTSFVALGCVGLMLVGASGAVAALGDTLFPDRSLAEALQADLSATSHLLIRLRILHPAISVIVAIGLMVGAPRLARVSGNDRARTFGFAVAGLAAAQIALGVINVALLAPVWMQMVHLLVADALWI